MCEHIHMWGVYDSHKMTVKVTRQLLKSNEHRRKNTDFQKILHLYPYQSTPNPPIIMGDVGGKWIIKSPQPEIEVK